MSNNRINAINQDHNRFIWIATMNGLNRYDGGEIKNYNRSNSNILSNIIFDIHIDSRKNMWLATSKGLCKYNIDKDDFVSYTNQAHDSNNTTLNKINCILEDQNGNLLLGTKEGLYIFNPISKTFAECNINKFQGNDEFKNITSLTSNGKGVIYAGAYGGGLLKLNSNKDTLDVVTTEKFALNNIFDLCFINDSELLIGTGGNGAIIYNIENGYFESFFGKISKQENKAKVVRGIKVDTDHNIWLGTDGDGLLLVKDYKTHPKIINYKNIPQRSSSLSGNAVYTIFQDYSKNYWIGTAWNGVNYLSAQNNFEFLFSDILGEKSTAVLSVFKHKNLLYFGLDGEGLTVFDTTTQKISNLSEAFSSQFKRINIQYIHQHNNLLWIGTFADGLLELNLITKQVKQYKHNIDQENSISYNDIRAIVNDNYGNLWIATEGGGLNYFDVKSSHFYTYKSNKNDSSTISSNNLAALQLIGNNLWIGTTDTGVDLMNVNTKKITHFQYDDENENSINSNNVLSLFQDTHQNLWIGTDDEGVNRIDLKNNTVERFTSPLFTRHQKITAVIEDDNGVIWFSSKVGIFNYNYKTNEFKNFPCLDNKYHRNSTYKDDLGKLYFGTDDGVVVINPDTFKCKSQSSEVIIKDFKLFNKEVPINGAVLDKHILEGKKVFLAHNQDVITFEFATLNYPFSDNYEYSIKMENFDENWRDIGADSKITYTNLSHGDYVFKVKSRNIGKQWPIEFASVAITVAKPFWLKWWAICFYIFLIGIILYLFRIYIVSWEKMKSNLALERLSHEKDLDIAKVKLHFFTNISHEIRTPLTLILSSINSLLTSEHLAEKKALSSIQKNSKHLLNLMNSLLDYRKLDHESTVLKVANYDLKKFCYDVIISFKELAKQKNIELLIESEASEVFLWFDETQMKKVISNLLSNAIKFTNEKKVIKLKILEKEFNVILIVEDQGVGIPEKHLSHIFNRFYQSDVDNYDLKHQFGFGLGLSITKEIIELHHAQIEVKSVLSKGTKFVITFKKGHEHFNENTSFVDNAKEEKTDQVFTFNIQEKINHQKTEISKNQNISVLIVEDNQDLREYMVSLISKFYQVIEAENGKQGLQITKKQLPDLIISDVMMPLMNGVEMIENIKSNINTCHIPVVLLTAKDSEIYKIEGFEIGAEDYIIKPFNEQLLLGKINSIIKNRQLLHERFNNSENLHTIENDLSQRDKILLEKLTQLIEANIASESLGAKFITTQLGMSHSVLYKKIKALTGLTLIEFITEIRLKIAKSLIVEQGFSVSEACFKVGYSNRKYFSKLFKKRFNKTPSEFKKSEYKSSPNMKKNKDL